ncbi:MAG: alpha/beta hydrolase [Desulfatitalea sp.]|nr:alpha/beta hydrolase [Desulfatitalea sp.]
MNYVIDPRLTEAVAFFENAIPGGITLDDVPATRKAMSDLMLQMSAVAPKIPGITAGDYFAPADNAPDVMVRIYEPEGRTETLPALFWIHGGAWALGSVEMEDLRARSLALAFNCVVASVEYRLAPEHPFPAPLEDCYTALKWLAGSSERFNINPERIVVGGESAGGSLSAGLCLLARDRGELSICYQFLGCPALDDTTGEKEWVTKLESPLVDRRLLFDGWRSYLQTPLGCDDISPYAAPARAKNLSGLPPAFIAVGTQDVLCHDGIDYAQRLMKAGVPTELHVYRDGFHGFHVFAPEADISKRYIAEYTHVLRSVLHD